MFSNSWPGNIISVGVRVERIGVHGPDAARLSVRLDDKLCRRTYAGPLESSSLRWDAL